MGGWGAAECLQPSAVISAYRRKCWRFLVRGAERPASAEEARAELNLRIFSKLGLVSPGVYTQDRGGSAPVKSIFPFHT